MVDSPALKTLMLLLAIAGWILIPWLPVDGSVPTSAVSIQIHLNGGSLSATEFEKVVTTPLEGRIALLESVREIQSETQAGRATITLSCSEREDPQRVERMVRRTVRNYLPNLPAEVNYPHIQVGNQELKPALIIALPDATKEETLAFTHACNQMHRKFPAVREIRYPDACDTLYTIGISGHPTELQQERSEISKSLSQGGTRQILGTSGWLWESGAPNSTTEASQGGQMIKALIQQEYSHLTPVQPSEKCQEKSWRNGKKMFRAQWHLSPGQMTPKTGRILEEALSELKQRFPTMSLLENRLETIRTHHRNVLLQCLLALLLLATLISFQMDKRQAFRLLLLLVQAVGIGLLGMFAARIPLSDHALGGITIGLGLGADQGIMIMMGRGKRTHQQLALAGSVITSVVPLLFLLFSSMEISPETEQILFPVTMVILGTIPGCIWLLLNREEPEIPAQTRSSGWLFRKWRKKISLRFPISLLILILLGIPLPKELPVLQDLWKERLVHLDSILSDPHFREEGYPALREKAGGFLIPALTQLENDYLPTLSSPGIIRLIGQSTYLPLDESLCELGQLLESQTRALTAESFQVSLTCTIPALIELTFTPAESTADERGIEIFQYLADHLKSYSGVRWSLSGCGKSWSNFAEKAPDWKMTLEGPDLPQLQEWAYRTVREMQQMPGVREVRIGKEEDREEEWSGILRKDAKESAEAIRSFLTLFRRDDQEDLRVSLTDQHDLSVAFRASSGKSLEDLLTLPIPGSNRRLSEMVERVTVYPDSRIIRVNQLYQIPIRWEYHGSLRLGRRYERRLLQETNQVAPGGCLASLPGHTIKFENPLIQMLGYLVILALWIWIVVVILFESLWFPFLVILAIPLSWLGPLAAVLMLDLGMDSGILAGAYLVTGISVNHMIFLLIPLRSVRRQPLQALEVVYRKKWSSIWLSVLSSCLTFGPFLLLVEPGSFWFSLSVVTISGLFSGVGLSLLLLPFYFRSGR